MICSLFQYVLILSSQGETPDPRRLLEKARDIALTIKDEDHWSRSWDLQQIAAVQLRTRAFGEALKTISTLQPDDFNWPLRQEIAEAEAAAGDLDGALQTIAEDRRDPQEYGRHKVHLAYALMKARLGDSEIALAAIGKVPWESGKLKVLLELMESHRRAGRHDLESELLSKAFEIAESRASAYDKAFALLSIADARRMAGDRAASGRALQSVLHSVTELDGIGSKVRVLREAARCQTKSNREAGLRIFENAVSMSKMNPECLLEIAEALGEAGFAKQALDLVQRSIDEPQVLSAIADGQVEAGDVVGASGTAKLITDERWSGPVTTKIVHFHLDRGEHAAALVAAGGAKNPYTRGKLILESAQAIAKTGDRKKAVEIARSIAFVKVEADFGDMTSIKIPAFDISNPESWAIETYPHRPTTMASSARLLDNMASLATTALRFQEETHVLEKVDYAKSFQSFPTTVLRALGSAHASSSNAKEALSWALALSDPNQRVFALVGISEGLLNLK